MNSTPNPKDTESYPQGHNHFNLYNQNSGEIGEKQILESKRIDPRGSTGSQNKNFEVRSMARSSQVNQSKRQVYEEPQSNLREEVQRSPLKKPENSRPQSQKCPSWLKTLILLISLVALGGFAYWFFFKRGKPDPFKRHKKGNKDKQIKKQIKVTGNENATNANLQKVEVTKTSTIIPVSQKSQQKIIKDTKKQQKVQQKMQEKKVPTQTKKVVAENKQSSQKVAPTVPIQKAENKETTTQKKQTIEVVSKDNQKQKVETAKVEDALVEKSQASKQMKPQFVAIKPVQQTKKQVKITQITSVKPKVADEESIKKEEVKIQQKKTFQENAIKENQTTKSANDQESKDKVIVNKDNSTDEESTIIVKRGNRVFCPGDQFLLNGNCMKCPQNMVWSGLNCVLKSNAVKHLKRAH